MNTIGNLYDMTLSFINKVSTIFCKCFSPDRTNRPGSFYTFRAPSPSARRAWLTALGGTDALLVHDFKPTGRSDERGSHLDDAGFEFVARCLEALEGRGLVGHSRQKNVNVFSI